MAEFPQLGQQCSQCKTLGIETIGAKNTIPSLPTIVPKVTNSGHQRRSAVRRSLFQGSVVFVISRCLRRNWFCATNVMKSIVSLIDTTSPTNANTIRRTKSRHNP
ncbi:unnamed protein product [Oppiella nova]|uniref:Uncharacterized protein n=1 Tax=Oppiella nova TaxID=334625 RepID=A0A7R9LGD3_9ACAR|nr:unnamed protein product [Oppiella nova]CAG2163412.1 unnamed protein product [Oppiella nova]